MKKKWHLTVLIGSLSVLSITYHSIFYPLTSIFGERIEKESLPIQSPSNVTIQSASNVTIQSGFLSPNASFGIQSAIQETIQSTIHETIQPASNDTIHSGFLSPNASFGIQPASNERIHSGFLSPNASVGACLMMKEDNDLLYEWIAYHYLMLPLRYLVIGSDEGNTHDPRDVLRRWDNDTGLQYWVIEAEDFAYRHGLFKGSKKITSDADYHYSFVHRQKGFVTTCTELMKKQGVRWVIYTDNDEFFVFNTFNSDDAEEYHSLHSQNTSYLMRKYMTYNMTGFYTALDVITEMEHAVEPLPPCTVLPRLRFGATEKVSCPAAAAVSQIAKSEYDYSSMSTIRYKQNAGKFDFGSSKYGKVLVDISRISNISVVPKNVHRPFKLECPRPIVWFSDALFYANHYTASWDRYINRLDGRRSCEGWIALAYYDKENSCEQQIHLWLIRFEKMFGRQKAQYLLGVDQTKQIVSNETCPPEGYNFDRHRKKYGWKRNYSPI